MQLKLRIHLYFQRMYVINPANGRKKEYHSPPDEPGEDIQQIVLHYFQESKKRTFTIVMLVYDEEAETDLNAITSSIQITQ